MSERDPARREGGEDPREERDEVRPGEVREEAPPEVREAEREE